ENLSSMKKSLKNKRPENKNQIFRKTHSENNKLKNLNKSLSKETLKLKNKNHELQKEIRILKLQLRMYCDNPRYRRNYAKECGCKRTPVYEMSLRQKEEGDPDWKFDTHCCFCKRATKLFDLLPFNINNNWYERCKGCQKKGKEHTPEREELYELRRSQVEKRERAQSSEPMVVKRTKTNPPEKKNVYANGPTYNPEKSNYNQRGESSKEEIDWTKDSEEEIMRKANFDKKGKFKYISWREHEEAARSEYCTPMCQYFDHKKLKDGEIHIFNANTTMIHDRKCCPYGAMEYDEAGVEYPICTCYRESSKYCAEHEHPTNPCKCESEVFWEVRSFAGEKCRWEQCEHYLEYLHCEHLYCWKHKQYTFNKYTKCPKCKDELGITGNKYWEKLAINIIEFKKKMKLIGGHERIV
ncbi:24879_t:CDS:2, partial [Dentiscutata erythropus]